ncbi:MAG TPA: hypothetical protein VH044_19320, partial [Polyangiaceae bacterium]|nr:hypothetical protein [Polyangiaceae bacterium]
MCASPRAPWLRVTFGGDAFAAPLRARVLQQLGADLTGHGIALCEASGEPSGEGSGARSGEGSGARSG